MDNNNKMIDNVNWFTLLMYKSSKAYCTDLEWVPMNKTYQNLPANNGFFLACCQDSAHQ